MGRIRSIEHVQLAIPPGGEERALAFYVRVLGFREVPKPPALRARGGAWLAGGGARVHLGVERDFRPAQKAHPAFVVEGLAELLARCRAEGAEVVAAERIDGWERAHVFDPFGNRLELMEPAADHPEPPGRSDDPVTR